MNGWLPALRVARRSVRRDLVRSVLVIALVAVPVAGVTVTDGLVRTMTDRDVDVDRVMGTADLRVKAPEADLARLLPDGSRVVPGGVRYPDGGLRLTAGDRRVRTALDVVVVGDPLTRHLTRLSSGRLPDGPGEVLVTRPLAERLGLLDGEHPRPGATVTATGGSAAAVVPAVGVARMRPVDSLAGRFRADSARARLPLPGLLLTEAGVGCVVRAGVLGRDRVVTREESFARTGYGPPLDQTLPVGGVLLGTALAVTRPGPRRAVAGGRRRPARGAAAGVRTARGA